MNQHKGFRRMLSLEKEATALLVAEGYAVIRFSDPEFAGTFFASRDDHGLFVVVARVHTPLSDFSDVEKYFAKTFEELRKIPSPKEYHFEIWVYATVPGCWNYYRIDSDRITEVHHAV